jgi:glutathione synthase
MKRIFPKSQKSVFLRKGKIQILESISELGIYGVFLGRSFANNDSIPVVNNYAGYLLRTKQEGVDEGGVASGYSVLNSICLV